MCVKLVPVALLFASSSLDMMLLSAGTMSCMPNKVGIRLCYTVFHDFPLCFTTVLMLSTHETLLKQLSSNTILQYFCLCTVTGGGTVHMRASQQAVLQQLSSRTIL